MSPPVARAVLGIVNILRIVFARLRASWYRALGARGVEKCLFYQGVRIDRPWLAHIGRRTQLENGVWLKIVSDQASIRIGEGVFIGKGTEIDVSECISIGSRVLIAPGVFITDHEHNIASSFCIDDQGCTATPVRIEDDVWIGARSIITPGVCIGQGAVVGAGAVVIRDVPSNAIVVGVPAKILRYRQA